MHKVRETIAEIVASKTDDITVSPSWVATAVMRQWDPRRESHPCEYYCSHEHIKQIARELLRAKFDPRSEDNPQHELFENLQERYPVARDNPKDEPVYILRDAMTKKDVDYNVRRFRMAAEALIHHADALQSWWDGRQRRA